VQPKSFEQVSEAILALFPPFSESEERVALTLYRLLADGRAVSISVLASAADVSPAHTEAMLSRWPGVYRDGDGRVIGYGGLSIAVTKHRMQVERNTCYTWCAWDTLFIPQLLGVSAQVTSTCGATDEPIALAVHRYGVETAGEPPAVSLMAPDPASALSDIISHFGCHVQFFASERAGKEWTAKRPDTFLATLDQAWELGRRHNALRYPRMSS
jgi:alkylmercury lyase